MPASVQGAVVAAFLVVPGFLTVLVYGQLSPNVKVDAGKRLLVSFAYGCWNTLFVALVGCLTGATGVVAQWAQKNQVSSLAKAVAVLAREQRSAQVSVAGSVLLGSFVLPLFWGLLHTYAVQGDWIARAGRRLPGLDSTWDPRSVWDYLVLERTPRILRLRLKGGQWVQGQVIGASLSDQGHEVWLRQIEWWDTEGKRWVAAISTDSLYVHGTEISYVECLKAPSPTPSPHPADQVAGIPDRRIDVDAYIDEVRGM